MNELLSLCDAQTTLTFVEQTILKQLPDPAHEIVEDPRCELQDGHPGPHMALGQESELKAWWVVWAPEGQPLRVRGTETKRRLYPFDDCTMTAPQDPDEDCQLVASHPGAHSFAMESTGSRTPSAGMRRKMAAALREAMEGEERAYFEEMEEHLDAEGAPLALITQGEATALVMMMRLHAEEDWVLEGLAERLVDRMSARLEALV
ncbi:hypothetical protein [Streptomyces aureoverticillatus]|uniref:hypothetical protein n=1 Tax=Streptomyces aureoverticillatus TaxID=66871 RepID=UPI0013D9700A|nr:hypothetical protein [Streptomyces aureoverticillatus]QIB49555.1 hypothetical protein G3H79_41040 [Streptomyces aureoverticillatus]